jgi:hypothetical protein
MPDHVHMFLNCPPTLSPMDAVFWLEGYTSRLLRLQKEIRKAPFDRNLHQQLARVLALFGADYPINQVLDKRMLRLAKKEELRAGPKVAYPSISDYLLVHSPRHDTHL